MDFPLIVQLVAGVLGGNLIGGISRRISLGFLGNSLLGIIGSFTAYHMELMAVLGIDFAPLGKDLFGHDLGELLNRVVGGVTGGGIFMTVFGLVKGLLVRE